MPTYGGLTDGVERYGGAHPRVGAILASLNSQHGTAFDCSQGTPHWYFNLACARAIAAAWDAADRMANQFDWDRVSDFLSRWERIFGIVPYATQTDVDRRAAIATRWAMLGRPSTHQALVDAVSTALTGITYSVVNQDMTNASQAWAYGPTTTWNLDGGPTVTTVGLPVGGPYHVLAVIDGNGARGTATFKWYLNSVLQASTVTTAATVVLGTTGLTLKFTVGTYAVDQRYFTEVLSNDWSSNLSLITIATTKSATMGEAEFQARTTAASRIADDVLPAWDDFHFVRDSASLGAGFWLDQTFNLDNMRFGSGSQASDY